MKLPLDWILQQPIDMEHKEYVLMDYISKIDKNLEEFNLYPDFQELSLHLANLKSISDNLKKIELKTYPEEIDDEILLNNIKYSYISGFTTTELKEIVKIAKKSNEKLRDYFLIAKSIWSIVFESVLIIQKNKKLKITEENYTKGYLQFDYKNNRYLYTYEIGRIDENFSEKKCSFNIINQYDNDFIQNISKDNPLFVAHFDDEFPLEGCLLSIVKRKIINYISQTIKLTELKENSKKEK